jgi:hypothetical protein
MMWIILVSGVLNLFLGLIVWPHNPKQRLNYGFARFGLSAVLSISFDYRWGQLRTRDRNTVAGSILKLQRLVSELGPDIFAGGFESLTT